MKAEQQLIEFWALPLYNALPAVVSRAGHSDRPLFRRPATPLRQVELCGRHAGALAKGRIAVRDIR